MLSHELRDIICPELKFVRPENKVQQTHDKQCFWPYNAFPKGTVRIFHHTPLAIVSQSLFCSVRDGNGLFRRRCRARCQGRGRRGCQKRQERGGGERVDSDMTACSPVQRRFFKILRLDKPENKLGRKVKFCRPTCT